MLIGYYTHLARFKGSDEGAGVDVEDRDGVLGPGCSGKDILLAVGHDIAEAAIPVYCAIGGGKRVEYIFSIRCSKTTRRSTPLLSLSLSHLKEGPM